jgi:UDP-N-acetylmuramoyl-tripeptide--D-alanyl-D-alanine ligase
MLELGRYSAEAHKHVGQRVSETAHLLKTVGFRARLIAESALDAGMKESSIMQYEMNEAERAGIELAGDLKAGDVVLVKGSQSMRMEKTVLAIMAEPLRADELLVRMDPEWKER